MSDAIPLPSRPNLEHYRKLARSLQKACRSDDPLAIRHWAVQWAEKNAAEQHLSFTPRVVDQAGRRIEQRWLKERRNDQRASRCLLADAQFFIATEFGFASWPKFSSHVAALSLAHSQVANFEAAADAIIHGNAAALRALLRGDPELIHARSTREHHSTLLHYVSANGVEDFRQKTPANILVITKILLDAGADVDAESDAYGGGCTTLGLVATSVHPEKAGVQIPLLQLLLDRGARIDHPSAGGNKHSIVTGCLANGQPKAAEFFAERGAALDLESAAALGRFDAVRRYFDDDPALRPRPDHEEIEKAFLQACGAGHREIAEYLLEQGASLGARDGNDHNALHYAAYGAQPSTVGFLLEQGVSFDLREKGYGSKPIDVALWVWDNAQDRAERCYDVVALLARAGATFDPQLWRDPDTGRSEIWEKIQADPRMSAALRGEPELP